MNTIKLKQIIREEIQNVLREAEGASKWYYMQFNGTVQPMGPTSEDPTGKDRSNRVSRGPLDNPTDILKVRRFPKNSWKEMDIYKTVINSKPGYVLISADNRNKWAIIQNDAKLNASITAAATVDDKQERDNRYRYAYKMAFDAVTGYKFGDKKDPKITPEEFLGKVSESASVVNERPELELGKAIGNIPAGVDRNRNTEFDKKSFDALAKTLNPLNDLEKATYLAKIVEKLNLNYNAIANLRKKLQELH